MDFFIVYVYKVLCGQPEPNTKEMQAMTDERVRVCVKFAKKSSPHLLTLHSCTEVIQINKVPILSPAAQTQRAHSTGPTSICKKYGLFPPF